MATMSSSSPCIIVFALLAASLLGTCMANKELTKSNSQHWGWGWGWGWSRGGGGESGGAGAGAGAGADAPQGQGGWPEVPSSYNFSRGGDCPFSHKNHTQEHGPNKIIVGGSANWNFGFNYTDWAFKNGPFYINDVLVFKYAAPVNGGPGHSVYLLPDFWSYLKCDLSRAKRVATTTQGGGSKGFEFKLTEWKPHYFACGEHNGIHCNLGLMKFFVMPIFRYSN